MGFSNIDMTVFIGYVFLMVGFGLWLARKSGNETAKDYFLASGSLPWWAVGGSLIASNISTEQILGMNGSGFVMGLAIAAYELMAALTLILVAKFFLPVFIKNGIYTMPQFLEKRYDSRVKTIMAFFWVALFLFVNITSIFYLGGLAINTLTGYSMMSGIIFLALYSAAFSIFGGLKAVVWTDVAQVIVLVIGGLMASYFVVNAVSDGNGYLAGLGILLEKAPSHFDMILSPDHSSYKDLPGIGVLVGGMWIANIYYWGNNQYIIQRALASKSIAEAQKGVVFAAFLKLLMPFIVVIPGIAAYVLQADLAKPDQAFPWVLSNYVGVGFKGLVFAALVAAIGSSISSMVNSASTIFTLDIYKPLLASQKVKDKVLGEGETESDDHLVLVGKISAALALIIGVVIAPFLDNLEQVFQYIQEYTGLISPGVVAVFIFGIFWKRATANAALAAILVSVPLNMGLKLILGDEFPFLDRMGFCFLAVSALMIGISLVETNAKAKKAIGDMNFRIGLIITMIVISLPTGIKFLLAGRTMPNTFEILTLILFIVVSGILLMERNSDHHKEIAVDKKLFKTDNVFNVSAIAITLVLAAIYALFW
jgi:solute:Na+ symporter, SSS family